MTDRKVVLGGKQSSGLSLATISIVLSEKAPFSDKNLTMCVLFFFFLLVFSFEI